ncbi:hypothetical protein OCU04_001125 [Sclerotinia nivalis]|uniref:Homeobox domain-containing protein n=1 Tax=Sclerotinia nivalis TaxID=352851 RepID=A0A9X0DPF0_9HELO|nr:hypothetical protein OCU04_001125 [Sclerotinia nivalis]
MMDSERKPARLPRWRSKEVAKLKEIIHRLEKGKMGGPRSAFWQEAANEMNACGYDRQAGAVYVKWHRVIRNTPSKPTKRTSSTIWDVSDSDGIENEEEEDDEEVDEDGAKSDGLPLKELKDDDFTPWTSGNNWSEEEDAIAFECIKSQREREKVLMLEPITAEEIWRMVSKSLASQGFYRKAPNVCRYWNTKGKEKHNFDARTPTVIEKASGETVWISEEQPKQKAWKPYGIRMASRQDNPPSSILENSTENSSQQTNPSAETTLKGAQPSNLSPQQYEILKIQYSKYNHLDNPVVNKLENETGLSREQIRMWYRNQRAIDAKEAELHKQVELPAAKEISKPLLDKPELGAAGSKRHRTSDIGFQRQVEEEPTKRVRYSLGSEGSIESHNTVPVDLKVQVGLVVLFH